MIFVDDSTVKIDKTVLPGLFRRLEIKGDAIVDEQEVEGQTKKPKQATGYEDIKVNIELTLEDGPDRTAMEKLRAIQNLFRGPGQEKPRVHQLVNEHTAARGVGKVIFKNLTHSIDNKQSRIAVKMEFWEYTVMTVTATRSSTSASQAAVNARSKAGGNGAAYNDALNKSPSQDDDYAMWHDPNSGVYGPPPPESGAEW